MYAIGVSLILLCVIACAESIKSLPDINPTEDPLSVHLDEWRTGCPPSIITESDGDPERYRLKARVETTSLWTSVGVSGLESMTSSRSVIQGEGEINIQIEGLEVFEISRPEDGANVGQNLILEIDALLWLPAHQNNDPVEFHIRKEGSGTTIYTLSFDDGDSIKEIARYINDTDLGHGDNLNTFLFDLDSLPPPLDLSVGEQYDGPLFDTHLHLVGSKDIKNTRLQDERVHINSETASSIFATLENENIIGVIGFLPISHNRFNENDDGSVNGTYQNETLAVVNRPDNKIIPFLHPLSHTGIPPNGDSEKFFKFIERNIKNSKIPFRGIGEIHTSYPQTDSYDSMSLIDPIMLDLYDYAAVNDLVIMIHPELEDIEDLHLALNHNPEAIFLIHGIIDSGDGGQPIAEHLETLFTKHQNMYFSIDAAIMLGNSLMDSCIHNKDQFMTNLNSKISYHNMLTASVEFWKPVIESHPTRVMWGTDLYYWWHFEPDVIHVTVKFGRDFISYLEPDIQDQFAYRNAIDMLSR